MKTIEYQGIKTELMHNHQKQDTYVSIAYTATIAVWTIALTASKAWALMAPMLFLIPIAMRISYCRYSISFLGAYLAIYFEGKDNLGWEYRREKYYSENPRSNYDKIIDRFSKWDLPFLSLISGILFWMLNGFCDYTRETFWIPLTIIICQAGLITVTIYVSRKYSNISIPKNDMMQKWSVLADEEKHNNEKI